MYARVTNTITHAKNLPKKPYRPIRQSMNFRKNFFTHPPRA